MKKLSIALVVILVISTFCSNLSFAGANHLVAVYSDKACTKAVSPDSNGCYFADITGGDEGLFLVFDSAVSSAEATNSHHSAVVSGSTVAVSHTRGSGTSEGMINVVIGEEQCSVKIKTKNEQQSNPGTDPGSQPSEHKNLGDDLSFKLYPDWGVNNDYGPSLQESGGVYNAPQGVSDIMLFPKMTGNAPPYRASSVEFETSGGVGVDVSKDKGVIHIYTKQTNVPGSAVIKLKYNGNQRYDAYEKTLTVNMAGSTRAYPFKSSFKNAEDCAHVFARYENGVFSEEIPQVEYNGSKVYIAPSEQKDVYIYCYDKDGAIAYQSYTQKLYGSFTITKLSCEGGRCAIRVHLNETSGSHQANINFDISQKGSAPKSIIMGYTAKMLEEISGSGSGSNDPEIDPIEDGQSTGPAIDAGEETQSTGSAIDPSANHEKEITESKQTETSAIDPNKNNKIETESVSVEFDETASSSIAGENNSPVELTVTTITDTSSLTEAKALALADKEVAAVISLELTQGGTELHEFGGGKATVCINFTVPDGKDPNKYQVFYLKDSGETEKCETRIEGGKLYFETSHFSDYAILYEADETAATGDADDDSKTLNIRTDAIIMALAAVLIFGLRFFTKRRK